MADKDQDNPNRNLMAVQECENHIQGAINALCSLTMLDDSIANQRGDCVTALLHVQAHQVQTLRRAVE